MLNNHIQSKKKHRDLEERVFKDPLGTVNEIQFFTNRIASYRTVFTMLKA